MAQRQNPESEPDNGQETKDIAREFWDAEGRQRGLHLLLALLVVYVRWWGLSRQIFSKF